tara:strand:+ start:16 stop:513 length:498 start_codon:yes stop_codon:yes gene_type:complete
MDKSIQTLWDTTMIMNYGYRRKMGYVVWKFIAKQRPDLIGEDNRITEEGYDYFDSLELRRCRDREWNGKLRFQKYKQTVDDFIGSHSLPLLLALADRKLDNMDVLANIRLYKWVRHNQKMRAKNTYHQKKKGLQLYRDENNGEKGIRMELRLKSRDKRTDWGTVK